MRVGAAFAPLRSEATNAGPIPKCPPPQEEEVLLRHSIDCLMPPQKGGRVCGEDLWHDAPEIADEHEIQMILRIPGGLKYRNYAFILCR
jgi:hypothetical protein